MESHLLAVMVSRFPTIQDSCPLIKFPCDLHSHRSFKLHPKLRSVSALPSAFANDPVTGLVGSSTRALLKSGLCGAGQEGLATLCLLH